MVLVLIEASIHDHQISAVDKREELRLELGGVMASDQTLARLSKRSGIREVADRVTSDADTIAQRATGVDQTDGAQCVGADLDRFTGRDTVVLQVASQIVQSEGERRH